MTVRRLPRLPAPASNPFLPHARPRPKEGFVTLTEMAAARGMQAQLARLHLKNAGLTKPAAGWCWPAGSPELAKVRVALKRRRAT